MYMDITSLYFYFIISEFNISDFDLKVGNNANCINFEVSIQNHGIYLGS